MYHVCRFSCVHRVNAQYATFRILAQCLRQSDCELISNDTICQGELEDIGELFGTCMCHQLALANTTTGLCNYNTYKDDMAGSLKDGNAEKGKNSSSLLLFLISLVRVSKNFYCLFFDTF